MAGVIGIASSSKSGLQSRNTVITNMHITGSVNESRGRFKKLSTGRYFFIYNPENTKKTFLFFVIVSSAGAVHVGFINHGADWDNTVRFYYDDNYIYYEKQYGGIDSLVPLYSSGVTELSQVLEIPTDATAITVSTATTA